jgi:hypothetical protein
MNLSRGVLGETEGFGSFCAMGNDPVNKVDPLGLMTAAEYLTKIAWLEDLAEHMKQDDYESQTRKHDDMGLNQLDIMAHQNRLSHLVATALYAEKYLHRTINLATLDDETDEFRELENAVFKDDLKSWIPVWGSARDAGRASGEGRPVAATFNGAMCALDVFIITGIGKKLALKTVSALAAREFSVASVKDVLAQWYARQPISSTAGAIQIGPDAAKTPVLGETALKGVGDDMLVHFSQTGNRASIAANGVTTEGASYFYRVGDVRNLTAAQVRGAIGPLARGGVDNSLAVIVSPEAASFTRVQMVLPEYVTMQNSVPSVLIRQVPGGAP